jgi:hypothetical protein
MTGELGVRDRPDRPAANQGMGPGSRRGLGILALTGHP